MRVTRTVDLAFDPAEPRDAKGRWTITDHPLKLARDVKKAVALSQLGDSDESEKKIRAYEIPNWFNRTYHPHVTLLHDEKGGVVGHAVYDVDHNGRNVITLDDLRVDPRHRGQGGGTALIEHLKEIARAGYTTKSGRKKPLGLQVSGAVSTAIPFYEKAGAKFVNGLHTGDFDLEPKLNSSNPTGTIFTEHDPAFRATAELGPNMTTLAEAAGKHPDDPVTLYRGVPAGTTKIEPGDYVTTNPQLARDYAGTGKVLKIRATYGDVITDRDEWEGEEHIYRPRPKKKRAVDLANPAPVERHVQRPAIDNDRTVRSIARVLQLGSRYRPIHADKTSEIAALRSLLKPYGIQTAAIRMAIGLTRTDSGYVGTAHAPNARLRGAKARLEGAVRDARDREVYFRSAYLANAAQRLQRSLDAGATQREAMLRERQYYRAHEKARRGRLESAAQVQTAARLFGQTDERGTLVGWYLNPLLNNEVECKAANGHNFYAEEGTVIGLPGSVHANCGCYAGQPHQGAALVNDVLGNVVKFTKSRPKFKLKERRAV